MLQNPSAMPIAPRSTPRISSRRWKPAGSIAVISTCATTASSAILPADAIIESPGFVDRFGLNMVEGITLPTACAATCDVSINVQRLSVEAAMTGNIDTLKLAVLHDPLVGAICTPDEVWQMVDEMVVAQAQWAAAIRRRRPGCRQGPAGQGHREDQGLGRRGPQIRPFGRGTARNEGRAPLSPSRRARAEACAAPAAALALWAWIRP